jgi:hypothetical protein
VVLALVAHWLACAGSAKMMTMMMMMMMMNKNPSFYPQWAFFIHLRLARKQRSPEMLLTTQKPTACRQHHYTLRIHV